MKVLLFHFMMLMKMFCKKFFVNFFLFFRLKDFTKIENNISMVFLEGQFIFRDSKIREFLDMKFYVEVDDDIRLSRMGKSFIF